MTRRSRTAPALRFAPVAAAILVAAGVAGCSFNWGEGGISDVVFGGRPADEIVPTATNADAGEVAAPASAGEPAGDASTNLRRIAILPVAYTDGSSGQPCDLCPESVTMKPTDALSARLVTGFIYEEVARHPRFLFPPYDVVERTVLAQPNLSFRAAMQQLHAAGRADYVVVAALQELRQRVGPNDDPEQPAGVAMYAALVDAKTGEVVWSDAFDRDESGRGVFKGTYDKVMNDKPVRWSTAQEYSERAADALIDDLVDELD